MKLIRSKVNVSGNTSAANAAEYFVIVQTPFIMTCEKKNQS